MKRLCMFVGRKNEKVVMRMESRESHNDKVLAEDYENFKNKGNTMQNLELDNTSITV